MKESPTRITRTRNKKRNVVIEKNVLKTTLFISLTLHHVHIWKLFISFIFPLS